jgi:hypothetical protein
LIFFIAVSADDFAEQEAPIVAVVPLPAANDAAKLKANGKKFIIW